jgi:hypothetical protein
MMAGKLVHLRPIQAQNSKTALVNGILIEDLEELNNENT